MAYPMMKSLEQSWQSWPRHRRGFSPERHANTDAHACALLTDYDITRVDAYIGNQDGPPAKMPSNCL